MSPTLTPCVPLLLLTSTAWSLFHLKSPTLSISHSYTPSSPPDTLEPRIIMATADTDVYFKVTITSARSGEAIRELIFTAVGA